MNLKITHNRAINSLIFAMTAQFASVISGIATTFVVPTIVSIDSFSYWQLFLFYILYSGITILGINDGVYVRNGNKDLDQMNKEEISGQFKIIIISQCILSVIIYCCVAAGFWENERRIVWCFVPIGMILTNLYSYSGYVLQASNNVTKYSLSVLIGKLLLILGITLAFCLKFESYIFFISLSIVTLIVPSIICLYYCKEVLFCNSGKIRNILKETKETIKVGLKIMLSSFAGMLIIGFGRFMIDYNWGIKTFGAISLAIGFSTFILGFVQQIGLVAFPILSRKDSSKQKFLYRILSGGLFFLMPIVYIISPLGKILIDTWLPNYSLSALFMGALIPICIFDAKMNMIYNTYFKMLRLENSLLKINLFSFLFSSVGTLISVYIFNSYWMILFMMTASLCIRSILAERIMNKQLQTSKLKDNLLEIFCAIIFILTYLNFSPILALCINLGLYILMLILQRSYFFETIHNILEMTQK